MALFNKFLRNNDERQAPDELSGIIENMNHILNTKRDYGSYLKDFGIRDLNEFNDRDGIADIIIQEVIGCVERYEPTVKIINVTKETETDMFKLSFRIECVVKDSEQTLNMVFDTVFNSFFVENT